MTLSRLHKMAKARFVTPSLTQAVVSSISVASPLGKIEMDGSTTPITGRGRLHTKPPWRHHTGGLMRTLELHQTTGAKIAENPVLPIEATISFSPNKKRRSFRRKNILLTWLGNNPRVLLCEKGPLRTIAKMTFFSKLSWFLWISSSFWDQ